MDWSLNLLYKEYHDLISNRFKRNDSVAVFSYVVECRQTKISKTSTTRQHAHESHLDKFRRNNVRTFLIFTYCYFFPSLVPRSVDLT